MTEGSFVFPIRVYYADTDAGGVVYHAAYLTFAEHARTEYLRSLGFSLADIARDAGVVFVVRRAVVDYQAPARLEDLLTVRTVATDVRGASVVLEQTILRGDTVLVVLEVTLVTLNQQGRAVRIPVSVRQGFEQILCRKSEKNQ